jgi:lipooligosaccharide transport system ATP-binding protein
MRRRLHIARALLNDPEVLVLDEPTTGLDPQSRSLLWEKIREQRREGKSVLLTTHYMDEAEKLSDDVAIMDQGRIIVRGRPADLVREHVGREAVEIRVPFEADARILAKLEGSLAHWERFGDELRLFGEKGDPLIEAVHSAGIEPEGHLVRRATLEDVFLKLTGRVLND